MAAPSSALYARVGALIVAGLGLAVGFVLFLTSGDLGRQAQMFETYVSETVQGLDVGAPVRYRGVQLGQVTEIGLVAAHYRRPDNVPFDGSFQLVMVRFAIDPNRVGGEGVPSVEDAVRLGLRARIASQGITGVNYVELDFVNPDRFPPLRVPWEPSYDYVPAVPSTVAQVRNAAEQLLARLSQLPLEDVVSNVAELVSNLNAQTRSDGDMARTLREAADLLATLRGSVEETDLSGAVAELRGVVQDARDVLGGQDTRSALADLSAAATDMRQAMSRLPNTMQSLEATLRAARGTTVDVQAEIAPILRDLRVASASLRDAAELLRQSPGQAIFGAPPPAPTGRR